MRERGEKSGTCNFFEKFAFFSILISEFQTNSNCLTLGNNFVKVILIVTTQVQGSVVQGYRVMKIECFEDIETWQPELLLILGLRMRPLKNAQFCSRSRKARILTTGIH